MGVGRHTIKVVYETFGTAELSCCCRLQHGFEPRGEHPLAELLAPRGCCCTLIDWPGFGDGARGPHAYGPRLYHHFPVDFAMAVMPESAAVIAAGHAAAYDCSIPIAGVLLTALHVAAGEASVPAGVVADARNLRDTRPLFEPVRACLTWDSVVLRHALRFGVLTAAAVAVQRLWDPPFGYWIPLTVSVVLKPYAGTTLTRGAQRLTGTSAGSRSGSSSRR
jgi:fusaric acid resistance family protein